jgi:hypothetical protein
MRRLLSLLPCDPRAAGANAVSAPPPSLAIALCLLLGCGARTSLDASTGAGGGTVISSTGGGLGSGGLGSGGFGSGGFGSGGSPPRPCTLTPAGPPVQAYPETLFGLSPAIILRDNEVLLHVRSGGAHRIGVLVRDGASFTPSLPLQTVNDTTALGASLAWAPAPTDVRALYGTSSNDLMLQGVGFDGSFSPPVPLPIDVGPALWGPVELTAAPTPGADLAVTFSKLTPVGNGPTFEPSVALVSSGGAVTHGPVPLDLVVPPTSFDLEMSTQWTGDHALVAVSHGACTADGCTSSVAIHRIIPLTGGGLAAALAWSAEIVGTVRAALATHEGRTWLALLDEQAAVTPLSLVELDQDGFALGEIATPDLGTIDVGGTWPFSNSLAGLSLAATTWGLVASWMSITDVVPPQGAARVADLHVVHLDHERQLLTPPITRRILDPIQQSPPRVDVTDSPAQLVMTFAARGLVDDAPLGANDAGRTYLYGFSCEP